jgi:hypothetical protein
MFFVFNFVQCESMNFVPYGEGTIDGHPVQHGIYTNINAPYSVACNGNLVTITSLDGTKSEMYEVSDNGDSCLVKSTTGSGKRGSTDYVSSDMNESVTESRWKALWSEMESSQRESLRMMDCRVPAETLWKFALPELELVKLVKLDSQEWKNSFNPEDFLALATSPETNGAPSLAPDSSGDDESN